MSSGAEGWRHVTGPGQSGCGGGRLLPRLRLFKEAEAARSYSAPNSPRPSAAATARAGGGRRRLRNASSSSQQTPQQQMQHQHQQHQQLPPPPPYPQHAEPSAAAAVTATAPFDGQGAPVNGAFYLPAGAATPSYTFQEVREISLGRHNEEPFGMKVECVGDTFFITHVVRNSVAACAGLKVGDEIVRINDRRLEGLRTREVLQVIRQSELCVKFAFKPRAVVARIREVRVKKDKGVLGLRLQKRPDGLYIDYVKAGTVAHGSGLKEGDQVLKINSHIVTDWSMEGAMALLKSLNDSEPLLLLIRETLPLAHVSSGAPQLSSTDGNGPLQQQQSPILHRQCSTSGRNGGLDGRCCPGPSERTASCSRLGDAPGGGDGAAALRRALGTNPCASTDDLEITRLPPETGVRRGGSASTSVPASSFLKSSRLTTFLKSTRLSRQHQPQHQQQQQQHQHQHQHQPHAVCASPACDGNNTGSS